MNINPSISSSTLAVQVISMRDGDILERVDTLAVEEPFEIRLQYWEASVLKDCSISVTMRTPGNDTFLAVGFLFTEGMISSVSDITSIEQAAEDCNRRAENIITLTLKQGISVDTEKMQRHFYTTSSCGVCGKASIEAIYTYTGVAHRPEFTVPSALLHSLPQRLAEVQEVFQSTGGLHASALFDIDGNLLLLQEDVGRHNALDKLIGKALLDEVSMNSTILLLSGRASFELIQKAAMAGISFVAAIGAPSSLAVQLADSSGITLVGFLNAQRYNIYTHSERIAR